MVCLTCGTRFAVGCHYCPGCTSTRCLPDYEYDKSQEAAGLAKITVAGGPSNEAKDEQDARDAEAAEAVAEDAAEGAQDEPVTPEPDEDAPEATPATPDVVEAPARAKRPAPKKA